MTERPAGEALLDALEQGRVRVAERDAAGEWIVHAWVKEALLEIFRSSPTASHPTGTADAGFVDKRAFPPRRFRPEDGVRLVPGGSAVRRGAYLAPGVVCMPPMYVNVGAWVGAGTMIDSHALVGSCAQVGERVHLSAGAQLGGVLEPARARPVIVEDDALVGGNCGLFDGVLVGRGAVIAAGVQLTASTPVFDLVREEQLGRDPGRPPAIPPDAVVIPGTRPARGAYAAAHGLQQACALIVKYRDARTDAATALEDALRGPAGPAPGAPHA